jgi:cytochrome P450
VLALTNRGASLTLLRTLNTRARQSIDYLVDVVRRRRARPGDDAVSRMLSIVGDEDERHIASRLYALLMVGTETSATFLSHAALRLIEHPGEREMLAARPDMLDRGIEELLRLGTPARFSTRRCREDVSIGDVVVPAGQVMHLDLYAANRDPSAFRHPEAVDLENEVPHLSFSEGLHLCLGARFARL